MWILTSFLFYCLIVFHCMYHFSNTATMYHIFFIHSSVDGHVACFHILAITCKVTKNIHVQVCVWKYVFHSLEYIPSVEWLTHKLLGLIFWRTAKLPFYIPTSTMWRFPSLHAFTNIRCNFFDSHPIIECLLPLCQKSVAILVWSISVSLIYVSIGYTN